MSPKCIIGEDSKEEIKNILYVKKQMKINARDKNLQLLLFPYNKSKAISLETTGALDTIGPHEF